MPADLPERIRSAGAAPSSGFDPAASVRRGLVLRRRRRIARSATAAACLALAALATVPQIPERVLLEEPRRTAPPATPEPTPTPTPTAGPGRCGTLDDGPVLTALRNHLRGFEAVEFGPVATARTPSGDGVYLAARIDGPGAEQSVATWVTSSLDEVRLLPGPGDPSLADLEVLLETQAHELPRFADVWSVDEPARELSYWRPAEDPRNPHPPSPTTRRTALRCLGGHPTPSPSVPVADGSWEPAGGLQLSPGGNLSVLWTGTDALVLSGGGRPAEQVLGSRFDPSTGAATALGPGLQQWTGGYPLAWTGTEFIGGSLNGLQAYDPSTDLLRTLPPAPAVTGLNPYPPVDLTPFPPYDIVQWTGTELLVWSGEQGSAGVAHDAGSGTWRTLAPFPMSTRSWPAVAWTGRQLVVWGGCNPAKSQCDDFQTGTDELGDGAVYDPAADTWTPLPQGPLAARDRPHAVWTGQEVVFWGGEVPDGTGGDYAAAYDPSDGTWRSVPEGPLPRRSSHAMVWSGDRLLVWGGVIGGDLFRRDGAAYDPTTDTWAALPRAPVAGVVGDAAAWTGREMVVAASADGGRGLAVYRP